LADRGAGAAEGAGETHWRAENDLDAQSALSEFLAGLQQLGWVGGRNLRIDIRFAEGDATITQKHVKELVEFRPDVIVAATTLAVTALRQ
jgi:hypothetical protein